MRCWWIMWCWAAAMRGSLKNCRPGPCWARIPTPSLAASGFGETSDVSIQYLMVAYVTLALGALCVVGILSELRRRRFGPAHPEDRVFRCTKCGFVYTDDADV